MKIAQTLPRPENWQDFETLCKKLWGEIWNCPEIKKNGRSGQDQAGIDVYGIPNGEKSYYGIQCKGKDEYTNKLLTKKEVDEEIGKALKFTPKLKKMYFATTAVKDVKIETYIRQKNIEHIEKGIFEVHLYAWEEIVELIQENKTTYDYYLNSQSFKTDQSVNISFKDGTSEITVRPKYLLLRRVGKTKREALEREAALTTPQWIKDFQDSQNVWNKIQPPMASVISNNRSKTDYNRSLFEATVVIKNDGSEPLEHWKLKLDLPEEIVTLKYENFKRSQAYMIPSINVIQFDTYFDKDNNLIEIEPRKKILVGDDIFLSDQIYLKAIPEDVSIQIPWRFLSKNFKTNGILKLHIKPEWEMKTIKVDDDSPLLLDEAKRITTEDFIETIYEE